MYRAIQNTRKDIGLSLTEVIGEIHWHLPDEQRSYVERYEEKIKREIRAERIKYILTIPENGHKCTVDGVDMSILLLERPGKCSDTLAFRPPPRDSVIRPLLGGDAHEPSRTGVLLRRTIGPALPILHHRPRGMHYGDRARY